MDPPVTMSIDVIIIANLIVDNNSLVHFVFFFSNKTRKLPKIKNIIKNRLGLTSRGI